jgi:hypothetical protein
MLACGRKHNYHAISENTVIILGSIKEVFLKVYAKENK